MRGDALLRILLAAALVSQCTALVAGAQQSTPSPLAAGLRVLGTIKSITPTSIVVSADNGEPVTAAIGADTRILRVAPGQKDLTGATPVAVAELQVGDRVLVRGVPQAQSKDVKAATIIVMKQSDVAAKQEKERADWQRGVGGLVTAMDAATGTITISIGGIGPASESVAVHTSDRTILRRYAPNSIKFDEAKVASLSQIKVGDQLRARGERSADGSEFTAQEVVSGSFRNIAGTVTSVDTANGTLGVQDAITKKPVTVKVAAESTLKKLPPEMAQRIAIRLKAGAQPGANGGGPGTSGQTRPPAGWTGPGSGPSGERAGPPDLQRFLARLPSASLTDLQKGDAVMVVSTEGGDSTPITAITLLAGVEPILTAAPNGAASAILTPWSLGSSNPEAAGP